MSGSTFVTTAHFGGSRAGQSGTVDTGTGQVGQGWFTDLGTYYNATAFMVDQIAAGKAFIGLVIVQSVAPGGVGPVGTVSVQPMVNLVDGLGNQTPHGTIFGLPYFRLQGGASAVIMDPSVGDIGVAIFCDRDISAVKATGQVSGPGSRRQNDWADGLYIGGFLNGAPSTFIDLTGGNIAITTPGTLTISASNITLDASGNLAVKGDVTAGQGGGDQVGLQTHKHTSGSAGSPTSSPTPGT
jgi:Phage protein Gp138 N-terminal domain